MPETLYVPEMRICPKCNRRLPVDRYNIDRSRNDWLAFYCKDCTKEKHKERMVKESITLNKLRGSRNAKK